MMGEYIKSSKFINSSVDGRYINLSTSVSIDDIGRGGFKKFFRYLNLLWKVFFTLLFWKPDICYLTPSSILLGMTKDSFIVLLIRIFRIKHIFHFHNKGVKLHSQSYFGNKVFNFVFKKSHIILLSPLLYTDIRKYVPLNRVSYCANGVPSKIIHYDKNIERTEKKEVSLLFLSNLMESKGILILLNACKELKKQGVIFNCIIAGGEGDIKSDELLLNIKILDLNKEVKYIGRVEGKEKSKVFSDADIFVFPSFYYNECFPLVILEAMKASLPVISTHEGAIPEIVQQGKTGLLVNQRDVDGLTDALIQLINSTSLQRSMGIAGNERFNSLYTLEKFEINFLNILKTLDSTNASIQSEKEKVEMTL